MKTLDEVIKDFEICLKASLNLESCNGCSYADEYDPRCRSHNSADVLHYLKEYKEQQEMLSYWSEKAISEQQTIADAYMFYKIASEKEKDNLPLSWEELMTMEGKPVWVEQEITKKKYCGWVIIKAVADNAIVTDSRLFYADNYGKTWQAYRKERS